MLRRTDVEFRDKVKVLDSDPDILQARFQIWIQEAYDIHRMNETNIRELKDKLFETIRRELYGEVERKVEELEKIMLVNVPTTIGYKKFQELKELLKCKTDTLTQKQSDSTVQQS